MSMLALLAATVTFGDLMRATPAVLGTGTFSASIVAGLANVSEIRQTKKTHYTIALIGDSMTDTLGENLGLVGDELRRMYPATTFTLLNYGVGGENIVSGIARVTADTRYLGIARPSLISQKPDVVVIESFAYNPFPYETGALDQHWLSMAHMVDAIKANLPKTKIIVAATIAPNSLVFGDGATGIAFGIQDKRERTQTIKQYLENAIRFAQSESLPLADAYHPSLDTNGEGKLLYINPGDHIHYSDAGRQLFARTLVNTMVTNKLLEQ